MTGPTRVSCEPSPRGWRCTVVVGDDPGQTTHEVTFGDAVLARLASVVPEADDQRRAEALVRASFAFLLEREPREAILRTFELTVIERYFPGYEAAMGGRVARELQGDGSRPADRS